MNNKNQTAPIKEGDTVTAWKNGSGREKATVLSLSTKQFHGKTEACADVKFKDGRVQERMLVGLLWAVTA